MKSAFDRHCVSTAPWKVILDEETDCSDIFEHLGPSVIVKPAISGGSMGVGIKM